MEPGIEVAVAALDPTSAYVGWRRLIAQPRSQGLLSSYCSVSVTRVVSVLAGNFSSSFSHNNTRRIYFCPKHNFQQVTVSESYHTMLHLMRQFYFFSLLLFIVYNITTKIFTRHFVFG